MSTTNLEGSVRDRLLAAANELFYQEGIHTVGIERVLERAGVAKASLYSTFGSKDELVRAYLQARHERRQARINARIARHDDPREKILAIFDLIAELAAEPNFRGCAFLRANSEGPPGETKVTQVSADTRGWTRGLYTDLAREAGVADPEEVGRRLMLFYDGAMVGAAMDGGPAAAKMARAMAEELLDAYAPAARTAKRAARSTRPAR
jgi:AcrR family transcriptional regulator